MTRKDEQKNALKKSFISNQSPDEKEQDLEALMGKISGKPEAKEEVEEQSREKTRVTLDLSKSLARKVKAEAANRDQTMKGFIVELLNRYFDEKISK